VGSIGRLCKKVGLEAALKGMYGGRVLCQEANHSRSFAKFMENRGQSRRSWLVDCRVQLGIVVD